MLTVKHVLAREAVHAPAVDLAYIHPHLQHLPPSDLLNQPSLNLLAAEEARARSAESAFSKCKNPQIQSLRLAGVSICEGQETSQLDYSGDGGGGGQVDKLGGG